jgi:serine/threonine protein phosphatase 1
LHKLFGRLPPLVTDDTVVFLGDYLDRGPDPAGVVAWVRALAARGPAKVIALRGNHEDAWLQVVDHGWPEFILPRGNGCLETYRSFVGRPPPAADEMTSAEDMRGMLDGKFLPADVITWMRELPFHFENDHAIYVHAGIKREGGGFPHPSQVMPQRALLWLRDRDFFENYRGKLIVFGHTTTLTLPSELSSYSPHDPSDLWAGPACVGLDTGSGKGGFLTAFELPAGTVYESRD